MWSTPAVAAQPLTPSKATTSSAAKRQRQVASATPAHRSPAQGCNAPMPARAGVAAPAGRHAPFTTRALDVHLLGLTCSWSVHAPFMQIRSYESVDVGDHPSRGEPDVKEFDVSSRTPGTRSARSLAGLTREPLWLIKPRELEVLRGIRDGVVTRDLLYGDLAPWMLGTRRVSWSVTLLIFHGLVRLGIFGLGPPQITARGLRMLDEWIDLHALRDPD